MRRALTTRFHRLAQLRTTKLQHTLDGGRPKPFANGPVDRASAILRLLSHRRLPRLRRNVCGLLTMLLFGLVLLG